MDTASDPYDLKRFVDAQAPMYRSVVDELSAGRKRSHWMWFIFPQVRGLGSSSMAQRYAIAGREEAVAYLQHPVLGARLREITAAVNAIEGRSLDAVFGYPDDLKFHSSMTLFAEAASPSTTGDAVFREALQKWFAGRRDEATLQRL
jgi:uncharacterized protein (DUF1810 family)